MEDQAAGGTDPVLDEEDSPGIQRRLTVYLIATTVLMVAGRFVVFFWGNWVFIPLVIVGLGMIVALTVLEARARRTTLGAVVRLLGRRTRRDIAGRWRRTP